MFRSLFKKSNKKEKVLYAFANGMSINKKLLKVRGIEDITMMVITNLNNYEITNFHSGKVMKAKENILVEYI